jgi:type IV pilus assembly protein PilE
MRRRVRGVTLVDLMVVLAITGVLASMALPSYQAQIAKARRSDAIAALTRVQLAQEQFRAHHGSYALALTALQGAGPTSPNGHYDVALVGAHAGGFIARALPRETEPRDSGCSELTVTVSNGIAVFGPSPHCWNR